MAEDESELDQKLSKLPIVYAQVVCNIGKYLDVDRLEEEITTKLN
jgi:hypothetical protein